MSDKVAFSSIYLRINGFLQRRIMLTSYIFVLNCIRYQASRELIVTQVFFLFFHPTSFNIRSIMYNSCKKKIGSTLRPECCCWLAPHKSLSPSGPWEKLARGLCNCFKPASPLKPRMMRTRLPSVRLNHDWRPRLLNGRREGLTVMLIYVSNSIEVLCLSGMRRLHASLSRWSTN